MKQDIIDELSNPLVFPSLFKKEATMSKELTMSFPAAIQCVIDGLNITKLEWEDAQYWVCLRDQKLMMHKPDGVYYPLIVSEGDLRGMDWVVKR